jgi:hypothetical protein
VKNEPFRNFCLDTEQLFVNDVWLPEQFGTVMPIFTLKNGNRSAVPNRSALFRNGFCNNRSDLSPAYKAGRGTVAGTVRRNGISPMNENFRPILCARCGTVVWTGISWAGFSKKLDIQRLTIEEEIIKKISGLKTYEAHRTRVSFEAVERGLLRIKGQKFDPNRIILADHQCSDFSLFSSVDLAPDYWAKPTVATTQEEGFPF